MILKLFICAFNLCSKPAYDIMYYFTTISITLDDYHRTVSSKQSFLSIEFKQLLFLLLLCKKLVYIHKIFKS